MHSRPWPKGAASLRRADNAILVVTHYERLLQLHRAGLRPHHAGRPIVMSGGKELAMKVDTIGYDWVEKEVKQIA